MFRGAPARVGGANLRPAPQPWEEAYRRQGRLWRGARLDPATRDLFDAHPELATTSWLDAGCGDGKGLVPLAGRVGAERVVAADRSVWGLRLVRGSNDPVAGRVVRADAVQWPFRDGVFGGVRAVHLVGHVDEAQRGRLVKELARVTRPGGFVVLVDFGAGDFRCGAGTEVEPRSFKRGVGIVTHYFAAGELAALAEAAGLDVVREEAERFVVSYGGVDRLRERWRVVAQRGDLPTG